MTIDVDETRLTLENVKKVIVKIAILIQIK